MKIRKIKTLIKDNALKSMPDVFEKIDLDLVMDDYKYSPKSLKTHQINYNTILKFASLLILVAITSIFILNRLSNINNQLYALESETEVIGFTSISGASLLDRIESVELSLPLDLPIESTLIESQIVNLNPYLNSIELFIGDKTNSKYQEDEVINQEYDKLIKYTTTDLTGNLLEYSFYYHISKVQDANNDYSLKGHMTLGENQYNVNGTLTRNKKLVTVNWTITNSSNKKIIIRDLSDISVQKYKYETYESDVLIDEIEIELLVNEKIISGKINANKNDSTTSYNISRIKQSSSYDSMNIQYQFQKGNQFEEGEIDIDIEEPSLGNYQYHYKIRLKGSDNIVAEVQRSRNNFGNHDSKPGNGHGQNNHPGSGRNS